MYKDFNITNSKIFGDNIRIIKPDIYKDERGFLYTDCLNSFFNENFDINFVHSKNAINNSNVLRGIHGDFKSYKLVQCLYGEIFQVVVDCRENSSTYLKHETFNLIYTDPKMILIPPGFGNAFYVKSKKAIYNYKLAYNGEYSDYDKQFTFKWNDPDININWPTKEPILSNRDK